MANEDHQGIIDDFSDVGEQEKASSKDNADKEIAAKGKADDKVAEPDADLADSRGTDQGDEGVKRRGNDKGQGQGND